jgi:glycosyltransferase involved in cell wall biosynthesis
MARRVLQGLQKASVVFYSTSEVRRQIEEYGILDPRRLVHAPYGIAPEFTTDLVEPDPAASTDDVVSRPFLLHVGSCIPRKRIDVLLDVFAGLTTRFPELRLVQVGGRWTEAQREQMTKLRITSAVTQWRGLDRRALAVLYRRASLVLQPSDSEGFGLPVVEALACGAVVVASDIPVLREVGGEAGIYCPPGEPKAWVETIAGLLKDSDSAPPRKRRLAHAQRFSWKTHTRTILEAYKGLR